MIKFTRFTLIVSVLFLFYATLGTHVFPSRHANACDINGDLDSAEAEGIVAEDSEDGKAGITTNSMSCKLLVPGPHIDVTPHRPKTDADIQRYNKIKQTAEQTLSRYQDYREAEKDGYQVHLRRVHQQIYHFTNWSNARANIRSFDPARPTSLLYSKDSNGNYKLVGAMYTAPRRATSEDLDARIPVSIVPWHLHTNMCVPPDGDKRKMFGKNARFGLNGTIATEEECQAAGGTFKPVVYNWMTHMDLFGQSDGD